MPAAKIYSRRLSPSMNAKVMANIDATKLVTDKMNEAAYQMREIWTNGYPILEDRYDTASRISTAIAALQKAQEAMRATKWLTEEDYRVMGDAGL